MSKNLITLVGKADRIFKLFDKICQEYGYLTLGDLAKHCYKNNYWILWEKERTWN